MKALLLGVMVFFLSGCTGMSVDLMNASAHNIGGITPDEVTIADVQRLPGGLTWHAVTKDGLFNCRTQDKPENATCVKQL